MNERIKEFAVTVLAVTIGSFLGLLLFIFTMIIIEMVH